MTGIKVSPQVKSDVYVDGALDAILSASEGNGGSFTCFEVEEIAELFERAGRCDDAETFRLAHSYGDDDSEDQHVGWEYRALMFWDEGVALETKSVIVFAEHRRARGEGSTYGPYEDGYEARDQVLRKFQSGDFDPDGCEVTFKAAKR